ncbi:hypothetical protein [Mycobacterium sp.]|uniref:hypothetical protein n=1 Tax=Mycobacterium sp. TaxID=1785 RepID=UPI003C86DCEF
MDVQSDARILTLAYTNDTASLDKAAIRTGRFDSIVEFRYPDCTDAPRILAALIKDMPGALAIDTMGVAAALRDETSGSDIREIIRRAVLTGNGILSTVALLTEIGSGRYKAEFAAGMYL